jgi:chromosome segregation ATPase
MQQEIEAERKWLEERKASVNLIRDMERSRAQALTEAAAARAQADGDELAAAQATLNGRIQVIEQEKAARVAAAIQATAQTKDTILREQMITAATREENAKKEAAEAQFQAKRAEIQAAALTKALENIKKEADANQAAIDKIVAARQAMSTAGSAAAQALNISGITNVDKVRTFGQNLEAVAKKFHMLREEGVPYRDLSTAIDTATGELTTEFQKLRAEVGEDAAAADLLDRTWRQFDFGNLRTNIENQRQAFEDQGISLMQINTLIGQQRDLLQVELPDAARRAGASIDDLNGRVRRLEDSFNAANKEMREFDRLAAQAQQ